MFAFVVTDFSASRISTVTTPSKSLRSSPAGESTEPRITVCCRAASVGWLSAFTSMSPMLSRRTTLSGMARRRAGSPMNTYLRRLRLERRTPSSDLISFFARRYISPGARKRPSSPRRPIARPMADESSPLSDIYTGRVALITPMAPP